VPWKKTK